MHPQGMKIGSIQRENREKPYVTILNHINHYAGIPKIKQGALLSLDAMHGKQTWNKGSGQEYNNMILKG